MERRELWGWLGGGAVALGGIGLGVVGLMADAQPLVYWSTVALFAACFVFGGVVLYLLSRHRFFGAHVSGDFRILYERPSPADESGLLGWSVWLEVVRPGPSVLRVVADRTVYRILGRYVRGGNTIGGLPGRIGRAPHAGILIFKARRFEPGEVVEVQVRSDAAPRITSIRREPSVIDAE